MFHYRDLISRLRRGESRRTIQAALHTSPKIIKRVRDLAQANQWLDGEVALPTDEEIAAALETVQAPARRVQESTLEPFRALIEGWVRKAYEAQTIFSALKGNHAFAGSYSTVQRFVRELKATTPDPVVRLHFGPGELAQVDFGSGPELPDPVTGKPRKTHIFVMTLAYSRHQYCEVVWDQKVETWLRCHRNAFELWGGLPEKIRCDNLKSAITKACTYDPKVQRSYGEFAEGYGFQISPCVVETPEHKGIVESGVRYVKRSFLNSPRQFRGIVDANKQLLEWVLGEAGNRVHGTTQCVPLTVFSEEEKPTLKPLPAAPVELAVWTTVKIHPDCHAIFEKSYYSVPHRYVGKQLDLRAGDCTVMVFEEVALAACHTRAKRPGQWMTNIDHLPPEKTAYLRQTPQWCLDEAGRVGPSCLGFLESLLGDRVTERLRAAQALLRLAKKFGRTRLNDACRRALVYDNIEYFAVKRILSQGLDQLPLTEEASGQLVLPFEATQPRFARSISSLFDQ